jgi:hypothetical protein
LQDTIARVATNDSMRRKASAIQKWHSGLGRLEKAYQVLVDEINGSPPYPFDFEPQSVAGTWIIMTSAFWIFMIVGLRLGSIWGCCGSCARKQKAD